MQINGVPAGHQLAKLLEELFGLADGLGITSNAEPVLARVQVDVEPFANEPEMRIINTEDLRQLIGIFKQDLFAQCLGQAFLQTSIESGPQVWMTPWLSKTRRSGYDEWSMTPPLDAYVGENRLRAAVQHNTE